MPDQTRERGWWGRNWKWVVPIGCLGMIGCFVLFLVGVGFLIFGALKGSTPYAEAVAQAQAHPAVQAALGTPIDTGFLVEGNISVEGSSGEADLSIPLSGPNGDATLYVTASRTAGEWTFSNLVVEVAGADQRIDLLE